ncbi:coproporphyrinogen III oxidase [Allomyces macrogynus ATCC 38327]|uniref:Coproporphyrinogen III oxidase n=1 Tax=Allomyces macrogynus (strain ATCC 38327) TaxID=578462 RepID=A0A0L0T590_ALLM3|nr:coproporphyrinogen III oxidase [Allomyces macrogynus ATCC 38327]|eukprot:KNE69719.1 coproporphyrinogen III oxidase [Allomyces macrogynus ATCC 38327]
MHFTAPLALLATFIAVVSAQASPAVPGNVAIPSNLPSPPNGAALPALPSDISPSVLASIASNLPTGAFATPGANGALPTDIATMLSSAIAQASSTTAAASAKTTGTASGTATSASATGTAAPTATSKTDGSAAEPKWKVNVIQGAVVVAAAAALVL